MSRTQQFRTALLREFKSYGVPLLMDSIVNHIMEKFDDNLMGKVTIKDPTAPEHFRNEFEEMLYNSIKGSLVVNDNSVTFSVGDKSSLGYDGVRDPMSTMIYIMEGIVGEYAYIPRWVIAKRFRNEGYYGEFEGGFLVSKSMFEKDQWSNFVTWEEVSWGFSNTKPIDIFTISESEFTLILTKTIEKAVNEFSAVVRASSK